MFIRYYIPEDGDDSKHPNVFVVPGNNRNLSLAEVIEAFPVPGSFHFRFYKSIGNTAVWMDVNDESAPVPTYQGNIIIKASRLYDDYVETVAPKPVPSSAPIKSTIQQNSQPITAPTPVSNPAVPPKPVKQNSEKSVLLNFSEDTFDGPSKSQPVGSSVFDDSNDLLGFTSAQSHTPLPSSTSKGDLFGLDTLQPISSANTKPPPMNSSFNAMGTNSSMVPPRGGMGVPLGGRPMNNIDPFDSLNMNSGSSKGQINGGGFNNNQYGMPPRRNF